MSAVDWPQLLQHEDVRALVDLAIREDVGTGDVTTGGVFAGPAITHGRVICRTPTVVAGVPLAKHVLARLAPDVVMTPRAHEGQRLEAGATLFDFTGDVRGILTAERCVLNFLLRLCGIATAAQRAVAQVPKDCRAKIYDTRKTVPGWRLLDKAAVRIGGAENHRVGLFDAVLIKDNHIAAAGSIKGAIERARAAAPGLILEVEIDGLDQLDEALAGKPNIILLDNFDNPALVEAVRRVNGRVVLEASGGVTETSIATIARTGVDRISMGALTHSVVPADLSLEIDG